jgi:hypothetical protein
VGVGGGGEVPGEPPTGGEGRVLINECGRATAARPLCTAPCCWPGEGERGVRAQLKIRWE